MTCHELKWLTWDILACRLIAIVDEYQSYINQERHIKRCPYYNRYKYIRKLQFTDENFMGLFRSDFEMGTLVYRHMEQHQLGVEMKACDSREAYGKDMVHEKAKRQRGWFNIR